MRKAATFMVSDTRAFLKRNKLKEGSFLMIYQPVGD